MTFENIYNEYFYDVYKYILSLCQNETTAEEVTQATFCKALEGIDSFRGNCSHFVWLCQIAKNTYFTLYRKQKKCAPESELDVSMTACPDFESEYMDKETARRLHQLLHGLPEPYKEVFMLRVFGELPYSQIGELFGRTASWTRLIFYRAKKQIMEALK